MPTGWGDYIVKLTPATRWCVVSGASRLLDKMDILPIHVIEQICITGHVGVPPTSIRYQPSTKRYRYPPRLQAVARALILRLHPSDPGTLNQPNFLPPKCKAFLEPRWNA